MYDILFAQNNIMRFTEELNSQAHFMQVHKYNILYYR